MKIAIAIGVFALPLLAAGQAPAPSTAAPGLDALLDRLTAYLDVYERELSAVVADERFEQRIANPAPIGWTRRRLQSVVSFVRLPGGASWLGLREVQRVNGKSVRHGSTLQALLAAPEGPPLKQAQDLALASAQHNLGGARTLNMPTLPLDLLHRRHRDRLDIQMDGEERVRGTRTIRVRFDERAPPSLVYGGDGGRPVIVRGVAWIAPETGAVWRGHVFYREYLAGLRRGVAQEASVRVEFDVDRKLALLVPVEMKESFAVRLGEGRGTARYSNFRRFSTTARVIGG